MALLAFALPLAAAEKTGLWKPFPLSGGDVAIFHCDGAPSGSAGLGAAGSALGDLLIDDTEAPEAASSGGALTELPNAVQGGVAAAILGGAEQAPGKYGGGLRLDRAGRLLVQRAWHGGSATLEAWWRFPSLPAKEAVLFQVPGVKAIELVLDGEGRLALHWGAERFAVAGWTCPADTWVHLGVMWQKLTDHLGRFVVLVDGQPRARSPRTSIAAVQPTWKAAKYVVGNDLQGARGSAAVLDELRFSSVRREYYPMELGWVDRQGERPSHTGQPYFRDAADLLLHVDFNQTFQPVVAPGPMAVRELDAAELGDELGGPQKKLFVGGVEREGLVVGPDGLAFTCRGQLGLSPEQGALALWFRPLDWDNEKLWNPFANFKRQRLELVQLRQGREEKAPVLLLRPWITPANDAPGRVELNPGRWVHLLVCWDGKATWTYVNGVRHEGWASWQWHRRDWREDGELTLAVVCAPEGRTVVDDLRLYRRPLSRLEVRNLAGLYDRRCALAALPDLDLQVVPNGVVGDVRATVFPLLARYEAAETVAVRFRAAGGQAILGQAEAPVDLRAVTTVQLATDPFPFGSYAVEAELRDADGKVLAAVTEPVERRKPPWYGNRIGVSEKPFPGWDPVRVAGAAVAVSRRRITLAPSGLPVQVLADGEPILAGPVAVVAQVAGAAVALAPADAVEPLTATAVEAAWQGRQEGGGLAVTTRGRIEFDGMMWFEMTLAPAAGAGPVTVDRFSVSIPYTAAASTYLHWKGGAPNFRNPKSVWIGHTPAGPGAILRSDDAERVALCPGQRGSFMPYVMLTGHARGMAWFAQNDQGWTQTEGVPAVVLARARETVTLTLNVIGESIELAGPRGIRFGLHPIPVKALRPRWRLTANWATMPDSFSGSNLKGDETTDFYRHPQDLDWEAARARLGTGQMMGWTRQRPADFRRRYGREPDPLESQVPALYQDLTRMDAVPEHTREWYPWVWRGTVHGGRDALVYDADLVDYSVWIWNEWLRRGLVKGVYMDDCWMSPQRRSPGPFAYALEDGHIQPGWMFLGYREYLKRMRGAFYENGCVPHMCAHTTHTQYIPYHAFFDVLLDGEDHYQGLKQKRDFLDFWSPGRLQFAHPAKWGLAVTWLSWGNPEAEGDGRKHFPRWWYAHDRAYVAGQLLHDLVWTQPDYRLFSRLREDFVLDSKLTQDADVHYVPYWDEEPAAVGTPAALKVSAWVQAERATVCLVNWGPERLEAAVTLRLDRLGFPGVAPEALRVEDVDLNLLVQLLDGADATALRQAAEAAQQAGTGLGGGEAVSEEDLLGELEEEKTAAEVVAENPDGALEWAGGVLCCPVRPHDYRFFTLTRQASPAAAR